MTKKKALQILIVNSANFAAGSGVGIRTELKEKDVKDVREAIRKLYKDAYGQEWHDNILFNMGI